MQRREFVREVSRSARWSLPPAVQSLVLAVVATLAHRLDLIATNHFVVVMAVAFALALAALILALLGLRALWLRAALGGRRAGLAILFAAPMLGLGLAVLVAARLTPMVFDVSTDPGDPPHFNRLKGSPLLANDLEPPHVDAAGQGDDPGVSGRRYALSADMIARIALQLVEINGWQPATSLPQRNAEGDWFVEAIARTGVFGFRDAVVIRVIDESEAAFVDMRSVSGFGRADLGANARRIRQFMTDLDTKISLSAADPR